MSETRSAFHPRPVYVAASYMSRVGKYNGTHLEALTFVDLAEQVGQIFQGSSVRREDIELLDMVTEVVRARLPVTGRRFHVDAMFQDVLARQFARSQVRHMV